MKKIILRCGAIGGAIVAIIMMSSVVYSHYAGHYAASMVVGYAAMILAFSMIFVALKQIRDKQNGVISFGKAFKAALLVTLVTSTIYVAVWLVCYYVFMPDFMEKYSAYVLDKAKADGASAAELAAKTAQMQQYTEMYKSPLFVILFTYMEILPVGLIVSIIAALVIKRKNNTEQDGGHYAAANA